MAKFSVIIPFYKGNRFLDNLFRIVKDNRKALQQAFPESDTELILVNDSPEEEIRMPSDAEEIPYRIVAHKENQGIHQARITGLAASSGDYILFLDQDDEISDSFLAEQYRTIGNADVVVAGAFYETADGKRTVFYDKPGKIKKITEPSTYLESHNQIISPGQCLIRKNAIPTEWTQNVMAFNGSDDLFLWILMFEKHCRFMVNPDCLYTHKYTGENISASGTTMAESSLSFASLLRKIPYVPEEHVRLFERSRQLDIGLAKSTGLQKIGLVIRNADIIMHRIRWKIKCM